MFAESHIINDVTSVWICFAATTAICKQTWMWNDPSNFNVKGSKCYQKHSSYWSTKWYGGRGRLTSTNQYSPRPGGRLHNVASGLFIALVIPIPAVTTMTKTVSKLREEHQFVIERALCWMKLAIYATPRNPSLCEWAHQRTETRPDFWSKSSWQTNKSPRLGDPICISTAIAFLPFGLPWHQTKLNRKYHLTLVSTWPDFQLCWEKRDLYYWM